MGNSKMSGSQERRRRSSLAISTSVSTEQHDDGLRSASEASDIYALQPSTSSSRHNSIAHETEVDATETEYLDTEDMSVDALMQQVKANVSDVDEIHLSINTPRMWTFALLAAVVQSSMNLLFSLRFPSVTLTPIVALLVAHPAGLLWDRVLKSPGDPEAVFVNGQLVSLYGDEDLDNTDLRREVSAARGKKRNSRTIWRTLRLWLGQGRWNKKEHACIFVSSNISFMFAFGTDVITEQVKFYGQEASLLYQLLLVLSTQLIGYSLAGLFSFFLVRPSAMIWPSNLVSASLFSTLHSRENKPANGWRISRWDFFSYVFIGSLIWYFVPGLFAPALSYFNVVTWFAPENVIVSSLFGVSSGLGMFPMTFDWSQIAYTGSPLVTPLFAALNVMAGLFVFWASSVVFYYTGTFFSNYLPMLSASVYDNQGKIYDISKILTPDFLFDSQAYHEYSSAYLPITYALSYAVQFASMTSLLTHTICHHGTQLKQQFKTAMERRKGEVRSHHSRSSSEDDPLLDSENRNKDSGNREDEENTKRQHTDDDVHIKLMSRYPEVPALWYIIPGLSMTMVAMFLVEYFPVHLPWWSVLLALGMSAILFVPMGIVMAITNLQISIYLISQIMAGGVFPGRGIANVIFATYAYITSTQGLKFAADMKLGHYMKVPPRLLFRVQVTATIISSLSQVGILNWAFAYIPGICTTTATNGFTCPIARVHFNGSVLWGVMGPARFFGPGAIYEPLVWAFVVGAIAPIVTWYISKRPGANHIWREIHFPVIFGSLSWIPPATGLNFSVWAVVCIVFNWLIRKRKEEWWKKYNMVLSAGLDAGTAFGVLVVFFGIVYWGFSLNLKWWGTEIHTQGCDWQACAFKQLEPGQDHFGPDSWK